ncbi:SCO7613 C-terminal domain-containing membrane protein [Streptomyces sp. NPDC018029]|uniref:SCO7613 C-terminal domain-containing membrane protein n=1 Tax=Streptomyces sp. NPDC018029 TaxID=3365032 RepID=UPI00378CA6AB
MTNIPPPAEELRLLDWELRQLEARRTLLLQRRAGLLGALRAAGPAWPPPRPAGPPAPGAAPPSAQNVLLTLGGVLLTVAAIAFTVVSWGHLGIGGRSAVLGAVTLAALAAPALLLRRSLRSTAEAVAGLGLALTVLDAYALRHLSLSDTGALGYAAGTSVVLATLWAGYGLLLGGLRSPLPTAVATAQLPLVLWAGAVHAGEHAMTAALLVTAAFDTALALWAGVRSVRVVAAAGACVLGLWGAAGAGWLSVHATDPAEAARAGVLLLFAALIALAAAWWAKSREVTTGAAAFAGLLVVAAFGGVLRTVLPAAWTVPAYLACGVALLGTARPALPRPLRRGIVAASGVVQGCAVLWALPVAGIALLGPFGWATRVWSGAPSDARDALLLELPLPHPLLAPLVLATVAAVLVAASGPLGGTARRAARYGAPVLAWAAAIALPAALRLPYGVGVSAQVVVTAALLAAATWGTSAEPLTTATSVTSTASATSSASATPTAAATSATFTASGTPTTPVAAPTSATPTALTTPITPALIASVLALVSSVSVAFLALATSTATLTTLGVLTALHLAVCVRMARSGASAPGTAVLAGCAVLAHATALVCAVGAAWGLRPEHIGLLTLTVPALAALAAARLGRHPLTPPVEITAAGSGAVAVLLASGTAPTLALALALGGLIASGTALRPDRRPVGYAAGALFVLASWVRLASWEVSAPEAYTLPVTIPALLLGLLRRRRDPETSSWTAYGPGLATTLLPSLAAAWADPYWQRPLLLGTTALALTLLGAHHRLRSPLVLGGTVLALDTLHELAPYIVQAVGILPRWLPPALAGLLLLVVGATYEQRLRDARRLRNALDRMR